MMKRTTLLAMLGSLSLLGPSGATAQPSRTRQPELQGDIRRVRSCDAVVATFAPVRFDPNVACELMGCFNGFSVSSGTAGQGAGAYRVEIEADGLFFSCEQRLPFTSCNPRHTCSWTRPGTQDRISVSRLNCEQSPAHHELSSVEFEGVCPAHARVRMLRNGVEVGRWESDVSYRREVANGESCGPVCAAPQFSSPPTLHR